MDFTALGPFLDRTLFTLAGTAVGVGEASLLVLVTAAVFRFLARRGGGDAAAHHAALLAAQAEIGGRVQAMAEMVGGRQADLARTLAERLDGMTARVGRSMADATRDTHASLTTLSERLAVIDRAQGEIRNLAGEVVRLQDILASKQARGAFGQGRMEAIVSDALPAGAYSFQATLSNGKRPDCLIPMPNGAPALAIDAKFPLEAWTALREAGAPDARALAGARLRRDMDVHVRAIAEKYLLAGETQDTAFLFVPSESIFADLHEHFPDIVQRAYRARVVLVSPSLLMLSIQVVQALLKDQRMREAAGRIQHEVAFLLEDVRRLDGRVAALKTHFAQAGRDIDQILVSTDKLVRRGDRIGSLDCDQLDRSAAAAAMEVSRERDRDPGTAAASAFAGQTGA